MMNRFYLFLFILGIYFLQFSVLPKYTILPINLLLIPLAFCVFKQKYIFMTLILVWFMLASILYIGNHIILILLLDLGIIFICKRVFYLTKINDEALLVGIIHFLNGLLLGNNFLYNLMASILIIVFYYLFYKLWIKIV